MSKQKKEALLPDISKIRLALSTMGVKRTPSEIHGMLCGCLCVGSTDKAQAFIQSLLEDIEVNKFETEIKLLASLLQVTHEQMISMSFDLHLLLPDDEVPLEQRAESLGLWCQGFSEGTLEAGIDIASLNGEETRDALYHITEIAGIDSAYADVSEEDEKAYAEVYEYIRMAVIMIHTELTTPNSSASSAPIDNHTLH